MYFCYDDLCEHLFEQRSSVRGGQCYDRRSSENGVEGRLSMVSFNVEGIFVK